jgi:hypothetical protein
MMRAIVFLAALSGCAYYNAMWSAERFAKQAERLEARGQEAEARQQWARAAVKAESVIARHPRSRWADDALVLQAEGWARAGSCAAATAPIAKARATASDAAQRERAGLAAAQCALAAGHPAEAEDGLTEALVSEHAGRRSRAEYLAGRAAAERFDYAAAVEHFRLSREPAALLARARALLAAGRPADAAALIDTLAGVRLRETERFDLFTDLAGAGGADAASAALDRLLGRARLPYAEQARLLIADGDRRLAHGDREVAAERYRRAVTVAPAATSEAGIAQVRALRVVASGATRRDDLVPVAAELTRLTRTEGGMSGGQRLLEIVTLAMAEPATPGARFRAAELARDSLDAPLLAGQLFLDAAAADSGSLYAPKALLAALALLPDRRDSITALLDTRYSASPYTRAYHGEASVAYAAAEDSLASELGVVVARTAVHAGARVGVPVTGPRGPWLDEPVSSVEAAAAARPARPVERPARTPPTPRDRPTAPERP